MTRTGQIKVAILLVAAERLIQAGDRILCLTGVDQSETIDTIMVLDMGTEIELFSASTADPLPGDVTPTVFERVLTLAGELGVEGREGRPVGTLFVIGDSDQVLAHSHQLVINPFHGYPETERNILDPRLEETIKEFSAIDGAFVIRGDGVDPGRRPLPCPRQQARREIAAGPGDSPPGRGQHHRHDPGDRALHLAIHRHRLDLQGRPPDHRHPEALGPKRRVALMIRSAISNGVDHSSGQFAATRISFVAWHSHPTGATSWLRARERSSGSGISTPAKSCSAWKSIRHRSTPWRFHPTDLSSLHATIRGRSSSGEPIGPGWRSGGDQFPLLSWS